MRRSRTAAAVASLTLVSPCLAQQTDVVRFIPLGEVEAAIMQPATPPRCVELAEKMRTALQENRDWWMEYVEGAAPGPLPYHPKLGLSEDEYAEFGDCAESMTMQKVGEGHFHVSLSSEGVYTFEARGTLADLDGIEVDLRKDVVRTPLGIADARSSIDATADSPVGPWRGVQWKLEPTGVLEGDLSRMTGTSIRFCLGQRSSGEGVLNYNATALEAGVKTERILTVLYYALTSER